MSSIRDKFVTENYRDYKALINVINYAITVATRGQIVNTRPIIGIGFDNGTDRYFLSDSVVALMFRFQKGYNDIEAFDKSYKHAKNKLYDAKLVLHASLPAVWTDEKDTLDKRIEKINNCILVSYLREIYNYDTYKGTDGNVHVELKSKKDYAWIDTEQSIIENHI